MEGFDDDELLKALVTMGFDEDVSKEALIKTKYESLMKAVEWMSENHSLRPDVDVDEVAKISNDVKKDENIMKNEEKRRNKAETTEGLTIKIRKFDSGTTWEENLKSEENEDSEGWPVEETKYKFSQKRSIAKGSFGRVYVATCPSKSPKLLAIKVVNLEADPEKTLKESQRQIRLEDLKKEVDAMIICRHRNIIQLYSCFVVKYKLWFVMPYIKIGSFSHILRRLRNSHIWGLEKEEWIQAVLTMSLRGIAYLHKSGRIHRDIKSGNILLDEDGTALIADLGLATLADRMGRGASAHAGTLCYFPPEMVMRGASSLKTDVWAIGIFALELARSYPPYMDRRDISNAQILSQIATNPKPSLELYEKNEQRKWKTTFSNEYKSFVARVLEKDPNHRPNASELLKDPYLKRFMNKSSTPPSDILRNDFLPFLSKLGDDGSLLSKPVPKLRDTSTSSEISTSMNSGMLDSTILKGFVDPSKSRSDNMFTIAKEAAVCDAKRRDSASSRAVSDKFKKVFESDSEADDSNDEVSSSITTAKEESMRMETITKKLAKAFSDDNDDNSESNGG